MKPRDVMICAALIALTAIVFSPLAWHDFVQYDDPLLVTDNPFVARGVTWEGITWALGRGAGLANWIPLTFLSHMLDVELFGLRAGPHHVVNVVIHAANSALLYLVLRRLTAWPWPSAAVAALFAVHPLHVESVAWVAERKDVLCGLFFILTIGRYQRYTDRPSGRRYALVLLAFMAALMSKPMAVTLPAVLLLLDFWPLRRPLRWRLVVEKLPMVALAGAATVVTVAAQMHAGAMRTIEQFPLGFRVANAIVAYGRYIAKTFWPVDLAVFYPAPPSWPIGIVAGSAIVLIVITAVAVMMARSRPYLLVGWLWFLGTMLPVIGIVQVGRQSMADRYSYLPHIGLFIMIAWSAAEVPRNMRTVVTGAALVVIVLLSLRTVDQLRHWKNTQTLFEHALNVTRDNAVAHMQVGNVRARANEFAEAEAHYREALRIEEEYALAHENLGHVLMRRRAHDEARDHYERALQLNPALQKARQGLNEALSRQTAATQATH